MLGTDIPLAPLAIFAASDGWLEVVEVHDNEGNSRRMCELGICPGKRIRVIRQGNPAIISLGDSRFALSAELLNRVFVRPVS